MVHSLDATPRGASLGVAFCEWTIGGAGGVRRPRAEWGAGSGGRAIDVPERLISKDGNDHPLVQTSRIDGPPHLFGGVCQGKSEV